jgi:hypothetical protein
MGGQFRAKPLLRPAQSTQDETNLISLWDSDSSGQGGWASLIPLQSFYGDTNDTSISIQIGPPLFPFIIEGCTTKCGTALYVRSCVIGLWCTESPT